MDIPQGNTLIEDIQMGYDDLDIMHNNLQNSRFTGYIKLSGSRGDGYLFLQHGNMLYSVEFINDTYEATPEWRLKYRSKAEALRVSTYVLSPSIVNVLSQIFSYDHIPFQKKKVSTVLKDIEQECFIGILEIVRATGQQDYILFDQGQPVIDEILESYGNIICSTNGINMLVEESSRDKSKIKFLGQTQGEIDFKRRLADRELSNLKDLIVVVEKGFIFGGDSLKVDPIVWDEWTQLLDPGKKITEVIVENERGIASICKVGPGKRNMGTGKVIVPSKIAKVIDTAENEILIVKPKAT